MSSANKGLLDENSQLKAATNPSDAHIDALFQRVYAYACNVPDDQMGPEMKEAHSVTLREIVRGWINEAKLGD